MCSERSIPCITAIDTARAVVTARRQGRSSELQAVDVTKL
jgi:carbamoyl-phosphate synthase large subunit